MPKEDNKILKTRKQYKHGKKSMKVPFINYVDLSSSSTTKINKNAPSGYSFFTNCSFYLTKNKFDWYRYKDCIETFCKDLKEHATKSTNYGIKEMMSLFDKENKSHKK